MIIKCIFETLREPEIIQNKIVRKKVRMLVSCNPIDTNPMVFDVVTSARNEPSARENIFVKAILKAPLIK